jgi:hypothetical protein
MFANLAKPLPHLNQRRRKACPGSKLALLLNLAAQQAEAGADVQFNIHELLPNSSCKIDINSIIISLVIFPRHCLCIQIR